jgi:hypothetical protein
VAHMSQILSVPVPSRRLHRAKRSLESKCHEIAMRSPKDGAALHVVMDMILARLNEHEQPPSIQS